MTLEDTARNLRVREFSVVITARNHNPTILNPDFLARNEIVSSDWSLAHPPVCVAPFAQVQYENGISVVSEVGKLVFTQVGTSLTKEAIEVVNMAQRYVRVVPHVDYRAVGINPKGDVECRTEDGPQRYIMGKLVAKGPWKTFGKAPVKASSTFVFELEESRLFLTVQEAKLSLPDGTTSPVVSFAANFHYELTWNLKDEMMTSISKALDGWQTCWTDYENLIENIFEPEGDVTMQDNVACLTSRNPTQLVAELDAIKRYRRQRTEQVGLVSSSGDLVRIMWNVLESSTSTALTWGADHFPTGLREPAYCIVEPLNGLTQEEDSLEQLHKYLETSNEDRFVPSEQSWIPIQARVIEVEEFQLNLEP
jgi:hypothetical protein